MAGVRGNERLTSSLGAVIFVLLAAEGLTILRIHALVTPHVVIGMLLIPPVVAKIGSTGYRFVRYYLGDRRYRAKGAPPPVLRLLAPFLVALTAAVLGTGVALLFVPPGWRPELLFLHKASFVLWFLVTGVHVLAHLLDTARMAPLDWLRRTRAEVSGAGLRQWLVVASVVGGLVLGALFIPEAARFAAHLGTGSF
jgi:hypothetical protein